MCGLTPFAAQPTIARSATEKHHQAQNRGQHHQQCENNDTFFLGMRVLVHEGQQTNPKKTTLQITATIFIKELL
jgi:hypothetical protein